MENQQQQVIDLCSSSSDDDENNDNNNKNKIPKNVCRRRQLNTVTATTATATTFYGGTGKRARMAAAAEARIMPEETGLQQQQQQQQPQKQQRRRRQNHHPVATTTTRTNKTAASSSSSSVAASAKSFTAARKPPPPTAAAAATASIAQEPEEEPLVFLNAAHAAREDNAIVTTGIGQHLANLPAKNHAPPPSVIVTCCCSGGGGGGGQQEDKKMSSTSNTTTTTTLLQQQQHRIRRLLTLQHVQQPDQWSCGFRNLQMLLFALVPQLERNHAYFNFHAAAASSSPSPQNGAGGGSCFAIPCLPEIEQALETAWATGFDVKGRDHYHGKIRGKRAWVGAVEIWSVLTYWSLDACVVQFIRTPASRRQLGRFLYAYFTKQQQQQYHDNDNMLCIFCSQQQQQEGRCFNMPTTQTMANKLLTIASSSSFLARNQPRRHDGNSGCSCPVLPAYLQWKGHSVTVIGVELSCPNNKSSNNNVGTTTTTALQPAEPINLLVLDPSKNGQAIKSSLKQFNLTKIRFPLHRLASQDVQVILSSTRNITEPERMARKANINAVTAT